MKNYILSSLRTVFAHNEVSEKNKRKIAFISDYDYGTYKFRMPLFRHFDRTGWKVYVLVGRGDFTEKLKEGNIDVITYGMIRKSVNPFRELRILFQILRILKKIKPDVIHTFGIKPNIYGTISARLFGISYIINTVTGLGSFFVEEAPKKVLSLTIRRIIETLLFITFHFATKVIFLNEDDARDLSSKNIVKKDKVFLIRGEGIDAQYYSSQNVDEAVVKELKKELNLDGSRPVVTMISRLILFKGVKEFCEAARIIKKNHPAEFLLIGNIDHNSPFPVEESYIRNLVKEGIIKWLGFRTNIKEVLSVSDVFVLPSYYREGMPITILEAMSMGKPIITTDVPGCRQTVQEGVNGFLVPKKDINALAIALEKLISDKKLREEMGKKSREKAEREFSVNSILNKIENLYDDLFNLPPAHCRRG